MKALFGKASAEWSGNFRSGSGTVTTGSGAIRTVAYGSVQHREDQHTCPDELMAAAQAGCFSMALASELGEDGFKPSHIETLATFRIEQLKTGWTIAEIFLDTTAVVAHISQTQFVDAALRAKSRCLMTRLFKARIWMQARLKSPLLPVAIRKRKRGHRRALLDRRVF